MWGNFKLALGRERKEILMKWQILSNKAMALSKWYTRLWSFKNSRMTKWNQLINISIKWPLLNVFHCLPQSSLRITRSFELLTCVPLQGIYLDTLEAPVSVWPSPLLKHPSQKIFSAKKQKVGRAWNVSQRISSTKYEISLYSTYNKWQRYNLSLNWNWRRAMPRSPYSGTYPENLQTEASHSDICTALTDSFNMEEQQL